MVSLDNACAHMHTHMHTHAHTHARARGCAGARRGIVKTRAGKVSFKTRVFATQLRSKPDKCNATSFACNGT